LPEIDLQLLSGRSDGPQHAHAVRVDQVCEERAQVRRGITEVVGEIDRVLLGRVRAALGVQDVGYRGVVGGPGQVHH